MYRALCQECGHIGAPVATSTSNGDIAYNCAKCGDADPPEFRPDAWWDDASYIAHQCDNWDPFE